MKYYYHFSGRFTTRAHAVVESDVPLSQDEINNYLKDDLYELDWGWGRRGEITDPKFDEVEHE